MRNLIREQLHSIPDLVHSVLLSMAFDLSNLDRSSISGAMTKYLNQSIMLIDYIPIVGPLYNATYALNLLFSLWPGKRRGSEPGEDEAADEIDVEKSRLVRVKGLTAVATALIDIFTLCLTVGVVAFVCDCLVRINTFAFVRTVLILFILANVVALTVGSKIITGQLVEHLTRQLEEVNSVGTSMVKSVTITASAIERIVETTNTKTVSIVTKVNALWTCIFAWVVAIVTFPLLCYRSVRHGIDCQVDKGRSQLRSLSAQGRRAIAIVRRLIIFPYRKQIKAE